MFAAIVQLNSNDDYDALGFEAKFAMADRRGVTYQGETPSK
jgi:hypothetical protein